MAEDNRFNITIECGTDFVMPFTWYDNNGAPYDLTGATVEAQLRESSTDPDYFEFACLHNGSGGRITMKMLHETTAQIPYTYGVYDVFVTLSDGTRHRPLYGNVYVLDNVTTLSDGTILFIASVSKYSDLPAVGNFQRIYYVKEDGSFYRWNGTNYLFIGLYNGIQSIEKTGSSGTEITGVTDSYRVHFSDGGYFDYTVKNGKKGEKGDKGDVASPDEVLAQLGRLAFLDTLDYTSDRLVNKPKLKALAYQDYIDYKSDLLINKPEPLNVTIDRVRAMFPQLPLPILMALYIANGILYLDGIGTYDPVRKALILPNEQNGVTFQYIPETKKLKITVTGRYVVDDAPNDGNFYARRNGAWVAISGSGGTMQTITYDATRKSLVIQDIGEGE